ncbi:MAG: hypothetical protein JWP35_3978 [Caulobacter sp.]|nr:hypothetical protein [Caulobacter sp.]
MSDFALHPTVFATRAPWRPSPARRVLGAVRYAGVLAVFAAFFVVRPRQAMDIYRNRRADSPLRRRA